MVAFILSRFARPTVTTGELHACPASARPLIVLDGLSEVEAAVGDSIVEALDHLIHTMPGARLLVADRLVRRDLDLRRWRLAGLLSLSLEEVEAIVRSRPEQLDRFQSASVEERRLLQSPYFLHRFLNEAGGLGESRSEQQRQWFETHASLAEGELVSAAEAAFAFYNKAHSRAFALSEFAALTTPAVSEKLLVSGALSSGDGGLVWFDHQLKHDFLAATHLAHHPAIWGKRAFDTATLHASSFDVLGLTLEQVPEEADDLVRRVYDWNPYGAAYVVAENRVRHLEKVSRPMEIVIQAVTAERRFHLMLRTVQQAEDALRLIGTEEATVLLQASRLADVMDVIRDFSFPGSTWYAEWSDSFLRDDQKMFTHEELESIRNEDSILGWTCANVAKRGFVSPLQQATLRSWLEGGSMEVCWRVVHILGSYPASENVDFLFGVLESPADDFEWVRYGATRSLIEMSALDPEGDVRHQVMAGFANRAAQLRADRRSAREFERAVFIVRTAAPSDWVSEVSEVVVALYESSVSEIERQRWLRVAEALDETYSGVQS